jgi:hypothetical protein
VTPEQVKMLDNRFTHHPPTGTQANRHQAIRSACYLLAQVIIENTPASREQATALTHLDGVMFNASAAIARNE